MRAVLAVLVLAVLIEASSSQTGSGSVLPASIAAYVDRHVDLTPAELDQLRQGQAVTRLVEADPSKEVAVFGVVWVAAPMRAYAAAVKDIETFERGGGFVATRRIGSPPRLSDFDELTIPDEDLADLRTCRVGDCSVKLSADALARLRREVDWSRSTANADATRVIRHIALEYVDAYLEGGNAALAVYRDRSRPTFVRREFEAMVAGMPVLTAFLPDVRRYLLDYPAAALPNADSFLYWQTAQFGLKPVVRINHLTVSERMDEVIVASKMIYASHYFWTALELRVLTADARRGEGFWLATVSRSRSDGLSGFTGAFVRGRARSGAQDGIRTALQATKVRLEGH